MQTNTHVDRRTYINRLCTCNHQVPAFSQNLSWDSLETTGGKCSLYFWCMCCARVYIYRNIHVMRDTTYVHGMYVSNTYQCVRVYIYVL